MGLKQELDSSARGIKVLEWARGVEVLSYFVDGFEEKVAKRDSLADGIAAVMSAWRVKFCEAYMTPSGTIRLDEFRKQLNARHAVIVKEQEARKPRLTPARLAEIRAVRQMVGVLGAEQIAAMMQKLSITDEELAVATSMMDED